MPTFVEKCLSIPGFGDHDTAISVGVASQSNYSKPKYWGVFIWKKVDFESLMSDVKTDWLKYQEAAKKPCKACKNEFNICLVVWTVILRNSFPLLKTNKSISIFGKGVIPPHFLSQHPLLTPPFIGLSGKQKY